MIYLQFLIVTAAFTTVSITGENSSSDLSGYLRAILRVFCELMLLQYFFDNTLFSFTDELIHLLIGYFSRNPCLSQCTLQSGSTSHPEFSQSPRFTLCIHMNQCIPVQLDE